MLTSKRVGYAVVGLGRIAERAVLPAFGHSQKAKLVALVSSDAEKSGRLAKRFGARQAYAYDDYARCLSLPEVEAVFISSVNAAHAEQTVQAAAAGKHVLCEKPMANTVEECRRMTEACRSNTVRLMIAYRKYLEPASLALKKLVTSGKLGRLKIIHSAFTINLHPQAPAWHLDPKLAGGGSLMDVGVYCVSTVRWLLGEEPLEALGQAWTVDPSRFHDVEENISFRLTFPRGVVLQASSSFGAAQGSFLHLHGEAGWAALAPAYPYQETRRLFGKINGRWFEKRFPPMDEFALELDAFADCIRRNREPEASGEEGLRDVAVMTAIYRSVRENRAVPVELA